MNIRDMPHVTVEQVLKLRKAALELEAQVAELTQALTSAKEFAKASHEVDIDDLEWYDSLVNELEDKR